jgi:exonuclease III
MLLGIGTMGNTKAQPIRFSVMTWNIWHGGIHGSSENQYKEDSSNTSNTLSIIKQYDPDVLLMQETYCCGMDIAKEAGLKYSWRGSSNLSIHSKFPIIDTLSVFKPFNSHGVHIEINNKKLLFYNIWLHYLPDYMKNSESQTPQELITGEYETRQSEIITILEEIKKNIENTNRVPIIIGGDFNSGSHLDWIDETRKSHHNKIVAWPVSLEMYHHGFTDSFRETNPDPVKVPAVTNRFLNEQIIADRIDYIYFKGSSLDVIDSKIICEDPPNGFFNSDHRAVLTTFQIH